MTGRRTAAIVAALVAGLGATAAACFPDYAVSSGGDGGGGEGGSGGSSGSGSGSSSGSSGSSSGGADATVMDSGDAGIDSPGNDAGMDGTYAFDAGEGGILANMVVVDGSTFYFQVLSDGGFIDAQATLDYQFAMDKTEVTVGTFADWVNAGKPVPCGGGTCSLDPNGPYASVMTWDPSWNTNIATNVDYTDGGACGGSLTYPTPILTYGSNPAYPITCVTWPQAQAVCAWQGKRLPTETEWRFLATGAGTRSPYPWGSASPDCSHAISDLTGNGCGFPVPVGSAAAGVSKDGVFDLVGSLSEWEWDLVTNQTNYIYPPNAGVDYTGPQLGMSAGAQSRDWIGQDFSQGAGPQYFQSTWQGASSSSAWEGFDSNGFRCAITTRYP